MSNLSEFRAPLTTSYQKYKTRRSAFKAHNKKPSKLANSYANDNINP